ncbi:MAG: patatin-like phospholipase family protein [Chthoniobacterales bacterium]|nr:patatin-like phospholipase family protein [Chthoniobacterales bacterium]
MPIKKALAEWDTYITHKYANRPFHPLFIVATEGGGIRAAYWTATVLGKLQDGDPSFADHIFAISGVSGGSVGAAVFDALVADGTKPGEFERRGQEILGVDFLSPAMAAMLYPDFLQRFIPFPVPYFDRGSWLEKSWEKAWRETAAKGGGKMSNRLAEPFLDLWQKKSVDYVPALFLNGTSVEVGNRLIASNLLIDNNFLDAEDAADKLSPEKQHDERRHPQIDVPLSTAAHNSARFTYVSPAGRFDEDGTHVVDGGYFENSGAATALDILREVETELCRDKSGSLGVVVPRIIMISNDPLGIASGSRKMSQTKSTLREAKQHKPGTFLVDILAPLQTLFSTREAHGSYSQKEITLEQQNVCERVAYSIGVSGADQQGPYFFSLAPATVPLPLGWMLSNGAAKAMQDEIYDKGLSSSITNPSTRIWNKAGTTRVLESLGGTATALGNDPNLKPR